MKNNEHGYTLIELSVVILIIGALAASAFGFALTILKTNDRIQTAEKMKIIDREINRFVLLNYRLPCPDNNGDLQEDWSAATKSCGDDHGDIPVDTLGLSPEFLQDAYDRNFIYVISPVFAQDTTDDTLIVHPRCRTRDWYYRDVVNQRDAHHKAPRKARFCCPGEDVYDPNTDIVIQDETGGNEFPVLKRNADESWSHDADDSPNLLVSESECAKMGALAEDDANYQGGYNNTKEDAFLYQACVGYETTRTPFSLSPNTMVPPSDPITAVAYALISTGADQTADSWTATNDRVVMIPSDFNEVPDYDDIVIWKTQHNIMEKNNESCVFP